MSDLNYDEVEFPVQEKDFSKIEEKNNICINVFGYEHRLLSQIYISDHKFEISRDLLIVMNESKSYYAYIKDFDRFVSQNKKMKTKYTFAKIVYSVLVVEKY